MNLKTVAGEVYPFLRKRQVFCTGNDEKSEGQPLFVEPDFVKQSPAIFFENEESRSRTNHTGSERRTENSTPFFYCKIRQRGAIAMTR